MNNATRLSILQAHHVLGLMPRGRVDKQQILEAYRDAAKKFHPDSRQTTACAVKFRQCHEARSVLLDYYRRNPNRMVDPSDIIRNATAASKPSSSQKPSDPLAPWRTSRTRRVTFGFKAFVLLAAACDGYFTKKRRRLEREQQLGG